ncbi:MAG TPA: carbohydrate porin [Albitalea sp.]|uniref:carbohydrate porin n=1 Tax=Piscinibacter sp. TaxID=1903157 RepID=UPI002ED6A097
MRMQHTLLAAAALSVLSTAASAVDWGGYMRIGPGQKVEAGNGDRSNCFNGYADTGGKGGIGRLGNECNTYGEFGLSQAGKAGGIDYKALLMTNFYQAGSDIGDGNHQINVNQAYIEAKGFDVAPSQTFWVGRRFYGRADVHMDDAFIVNMTGSGAGVDGFDLGFGTLNVAVFRTAEQNPSTMPGDPHDALADIHGTRINLDLQGINTNPGGKLRVTTTFTKAKGTGGKSGAALSFQHNQTGLYGADNTLWLQFAQGSASMNQNFGGATNDSGVKGWRIVESPAWTKGPLTGQAMFTIGKEGPSNAKTSFNSLAGRVAYAVTNNFKIQGELGTANSKPQGGQTARVTKFTIAPTLSVGPNYYDRPELRFYVSTFNFNDTYKATQGLTKSSKSSVGIQAEIWF